VTALASPAPLRAAAVGLPADAMAWETWLREHLTTDWRPTEWNHDAWLFTGDVNNPQTSLWPCSVRACVNQLHIRHSFCKQCAIELRRYAGNADEFVATYVPKRRMGCATVKSSCLVERDGQRCTRPAVSSAVVSRWESASGWPASRSPSWTPCRATSSAAVGRS
jgi:hypothetical protein